MPYDSQSAWNQAGQTATAATQMYMQGQMDRKDRKFSEMMSNRAREWALEDWQRNNLYNSPASQMQRFREAGLNPNLIYGSQTNAAPVRSSDTPQNFRSTKPDLSGVQAALQSGYDMRQKSAQTDLLAKQLDVADKDIQLKAAQTFKTLTDVDRTKVGIASDEFDLAKRNSLLPFDLQAAELNNANKWRDLENKTDYNLRENAKIDLHVDYMREQILNAQQGRRVSDAQIRVINQTLENLKTAGSIQKLTLELNKAGLTWSDEAWQRLGITLSRKFGAKY